MKSHPSSFHKCRARLLSPSWSLIVGLGVRVLRLHVVDSGRLSVSLHIGGNIPCSAEMKPCALTANLSASRRQPTSTEGGPISLFRGSLSKSSFDSAYPRDYACSALQELVGSLSHDTEMVSLPLAQPASSP